MIGEFDIYGVFLSPVLVSAVIALLVFVIVHRILARLGAYRIVWHPALVDGAVFVIIWALVATLPLPELS